MRLGIDFGTTRTVVAAVEDGNYPICTFDDHGDVRDYIPTLAAVKDGKLCFGWEAAKWRLDPNVPRIRSLKRLMAQYKPDDIFEATEGFQLPFFELIVGFLVHLKRSLVHGSHLSLSGGRKPLEAIVGIPANANSNQRFMTLEAFKAAGFNVAGLMNEPSAGAVEFSQRYLRNLGAKSPKAYVVIYDFGGGTFDTSVVGLSEQNYAVISHQGAGRLGGEDIDGIIGDLVVKKLGPSAPSFTGNQAAWLLEECRERKESIRPNTQKIIVDLEPVMGRDVTAIVETQDIYAACEPLIRQSLEVLHQAIDPLRRIGIDPATHPGVAAVYLVGGSVAFPPVSRALREVYGRKVKVSPIPYGATAIGLAIAADPRARIRLEESIARNFGVWREQHDGRDKIFDLIFEKNIPVDPEAGRHRIVRRYRPAHNIGRLRYLECSGLGPGGEPQGDITPWQEVVFPYDPELKDRKKLSGLKVEKRQDLSGQDIVETYLYDRGGAIELEIENRTAGYGKKFTLNR